MKAIGVAGQLRNGKNEVANYLVTRLSGFERAAFAANVKRIYCETFGVSLAFVEEWKTRPEIPPGFDMNVRQGLQFIGDGFRKIQGDIWIDLAFRHDRNIILSDVRYINELSKIRSVGGINILIYRPGFLNDDPNGSEAQIRPFVTALDALGVEGVIRPESHFDVPVDLIDIFIRNEGTILELQRKVDDFVLPYVYEKYQEVVRKLPRR
jgi:hypothetical protein